MNFGGRNRRTFAIYVPLLQKAPSRSRSSKLARQKRHQLSRTETVQQKALDGTMPTLPAISPRGNAAASSNRSKKVRASRIASARVLFTEYTAVTCTLHSA